MTTRKAHAASDGPRKAARQDATPAAMRPWLKGLLSALIALHVTAVFWGPFAFASRGSPFADGVFAVLRPYIDGMYLNHGYSFFAPDVGPSHLVDYKIEFDDGRPPVTGRFPNLAEERPRLLYHRHFMLAEALNNRFVPAQPLPEPTPPPLTATADERLRYQLQHQYYQRDLAMWRHERLQYDAMRKSFEEHLKKVHGGSRVTLTRIEHRLAAPDEVRRLKQPLGAEAFYLNLPESPPPEPQR